MAKMNEGKNRNVVDQVQFIVRVLAIACYMEDVPVSDQFLSTLYKSLSMENIKFDRDAKPFHDALQIFPEESLRYLN